MLDYILHLDKYLQQIVQDYGTWTYLIIATIVFLESAFVIFPFLPGDSLLFATGVACNRYEGLNVWLMIVILVASGFIGNDINYRLGRKYGRKLFSKPNHKFFNQANLDKTNAFFAKHGAKAVVLARFVPFVRSFVPFVAGMADMEYLRFTKFNIAGAIGWVTSFTLIGYYFSKIPWVEKNFHIAILLIIVVTLVPIVVEVWRHKKVAKREARGKIPPPATEVVNE